jgi:hypothetical protein
MVHFEGISLPVTDLDRSITCHETLGFATEALVQIELCDPDGLTVEFAQGRRRAKAD